VNRFGERAWQGGNGRPRIRQSGSKRSSTRPAERTAYDRYKIQQIQRFVGRADMTVAMRRGACLFSTIPWLRNL
jgi:hypothetical protein